jgi:protocatechuate 3,4-dioxygenase, alpha subunit
MMERAERALIPSPSQTLGPFFDFCLTPDAKRGTLFPDSRSRVRLAVRVTDGAAQPVTDAVVEIWQVCDVPGGDSAFGRLGTGEDGTCEFDTVRPCDPAGGAAHINICLFARGLLRHLFTRLYFSGDSRIAEDPVLARVPPHRRATLLAQRDSTSAGRWVFEIRLQGPEETVFFDV